MSRKEIIYPVANPTIGDKEKEYVKKCLETNWISSSGEYISKFEGLFSETLSLENAVAVCNGTIAIDLALAAVGVSPGDEVIVPNFTFVGSVSPVFRVQAIPVLAPTSKEHWGMDAEAIEGLITKKTKAIVAVHLYGVPCDIMRIRQIADDHGLMLIEDCAEAIGAKVGGKVVGNFGDVSCFSFFGNKVITTGEGGMCTASSKDLSQRIRLFRDHGMTNDARYWHKVIGYNGRMTNMQAAIGYGQCQSFAEILATRWKIHEQYQKVFTNSPHFHAIKEPKGSDSVCWLESPVLKEGLDRDKLMSDLEKDGIETRPFFFPCSSVPAYSRYGQDDQYSTFYSKQGLNLPTYTSLSANDVEHIAERVVHHLDQAS